MALPPNRPLRLGVVADTHSRPHDKIVDLLKRDRVDAVLHAGDIGNQDVLKHLSACGPVTEVRGNIDGRGESPDSVDIAIGNDTADVLRILLTHIAVAGPRIRTSVANLAKRHGASLIVCGHSHVPFIGEDKGLSVFNPGSIGPRRFRLPITYGLLDVSEESVRVCHMSCETGERWLPG